MYKFWGSFVIPSRLYAYQPLQVEGFVVFGVQGTWTKCVTFSTLICFDQAMCSVFFKHCCNAVRIRRRLNSPLNSTRPLLCRDSWVWYKCSIWILEQINTACKQTVMLAYQPAVCGRHSKAQLPVLLLWFACIPVLQQGPHLPAAAAPNC